MATYQGYNEIIVEKQNKVLLIKFSNPKKKNCLNRKSYAEIRRIMLEVANDEEVSIVVFTGVGEFFTAGNDLSQDSSADTDMESFIEKTTSDFSELIRAIVDCPKVLISLVNGPCIGIGTTLSGLCDMAWCSESAYFLTPFTKLGIVPEAGSSYLLPLILGRSQATEMLLFSEKMTAAEAYHCNFVSKVFKLSELDSVIWPKIREFSELPPKSLQASKKLLRDHERNAIYKAVAAECEELKNRFVDEEFINAVLQFAMRKQKSKL